MTKGELVAALAQYPDDMEILICHDDDAQYGRNASDIDSITVQTQKVGIITKNPRKYDAIVLDVSCCGL
jgi:hypothetical protein